MRDAPKFGGLTLPTPGQSKRPPSWRRQERAEGGPGWFERKAPAEFPFLKAAWATWSWVKALKSSHRNAIVLRLSAPPNL